MEAVHDLRDLILNTREPLVIRNVQPRWNCFNGTLRDWCKRYDTETKKPAQFERISVKCGQRPQWERNRQLINLSAQRFFEEHSEEQDFWSALHYKRTQELPTTCVEGIEFERFGFEEASDDATLWLSAKGANTPTHYDTYGCNIVCQQYGRKSWLLLPPGTPLTTCRVPYEESSVYCVENFYAPQPAHVDNLCHRLSDFAYRCVLNAGDVLIVPRHWWHFVEALDLSISVNAWLPLSVDVEAQLDECIVKYVMESSVRQADLQNGAEVTSQLLNPNQLSLIADEPKLLRLIQHLRSKAVTITTKSTSKEEEIERCYPYQYMQPYEVEELLARMPNVEKLPRLSDEQLKEFLSQNSQRFDENFSDTDQSPLNAFREELLNSICAPKIIASIREEFCKRFDGV